MVRMHWPGVLALTEREAAAEVQAGPARGWRRSWAVRSPRPSHEEFRMGQRYSQLNVVAGGRKQAPRGRVRRVDIV